MISVREGKAQETGERVTRCCLEGSSKEDALRRLRARNRIRSAFGELSTTYIVSPYLARHPASQGNPLKILSEARNIFIRELRVWRGKTPANSLNSPLT